jgi:hypothetical protein
MLSNVRGIKVGIGLKYGLLFSLDLLLARLRISLILQWQHHKFSKPEIS